MALRPWPVSPNRERPQLQDGVSDMVERQTDKMARSVPIKAAAAVDRKEVKVRTAYADCGRRQLNVVNGCAWGLKADGAQNDTGHFEKMVK